MEEVEAGLMAAVVLAGAKGAHAQEQRSRRANHWKLI